MSSAKAMKVPKPWEETYAALTEMTDQCCARHLNEEYAEFARQAIAALCRKRSCPFVTGNPGTWACAVLYALGQVNFLADKASQPYMSMADLRGYFGIGAAAAASRAKQVRKLLGMAMFEPRWMLPSHAARNPLAGLFGGGLIVIHRERPA